MGAKKIINSFRDFNYETDVVNDQDFSALGSATMEFYTSGIFKNFFAEKCGEKGEDFHTALKKLNKNKKPLQIKKPNDKNAEKGDVLLSLVANDELSDLFSEFTDLLDGQKKKIGLDMPVLLTPSKGTQEPSYSTESSKPLIIIVGESALRTKLVNDKTGIIHVGTPYAVHQIIGSPEQCDTYKYIFAQLLNISSKGIDGELLKKLLLGFDSNSMPEGQSKPYNPLKDCSIYLTDIIKFWYENIKLDDALKVTLNKVLIVKELLKLKKEFSSIYIVTFGKRAKSVLNQGKITEIIGEVKDHPSIKNDINEINLDDLNFIHILHPSGKNAERWRHKIHKRAAYLGNKKYIIARYGGYDDHLTTTSKLIAEEAFLEILEGIIKKKQQQNDNKDSSEQ